MRLGSQFIVLKVASVELIAWGNEHRGRASREIAQDEVRETESGKLSGFCDWDEWIPLTWEQVGMWWGRHELKRIGNYPELL